MMIAIVSDTHDNIPRLKQLLDVLNLEKINTLIHCGDVTTNQTLKYILDNFSGQIYLSCGNVDKMHDLIIPKNSNLKSFESFGELEIQNTKIAFTHFPETAKELANKNKYDFVFYGHTHEPWEEIINNTRLVNPGTLAGMFNKSTFAVLDTETKNIELRIL